MSDSVGLETFYFGGGGDFKLDFWFSWRHGGLYSSVLGLFTGMVLELSLLLLDKSFIDSDGYNLRGIHRS